MAQNESLAAQKEDMAKEKDDQLYQNQISKHQNHISKNQDAELPQNAIKCIYFLTFLFIIALCLYSVDFYPEKSDDGAITKNSLRQKQQSFQKQLGSGPRSTSGKGDGNGQLQKTSFKKNQALENRPQQQIQIRQILTQIKQIKIQLEATREDMVDYKESSNKEFNKLKLALLNYEGLQLKSFPNQIFEIQDEKLSLNSGNSVFEPSNKVWVYEQSPDNYLSELISRNIRHYAILSGYEVIPVNTNTFKTYMPADAHYRASSLISTLKKRLKQNNHGNLDNHIQDIIKKIVLLSVLHHNGGIILSGPFAFTENFTWLQTISKNPYVNRGNRGAKPQVVGFYSPYYSSQKKKENIKLFEGIQEVDKFMSVFPAMESYFMAANNKTEFLEIVLQRINQLLLYPQRFKELRSAYTLTNLKGDDMYYEYFLLAVQTTLQDAQRFIDAKPAASHRFFAIDYFGLNLINCHYAPYKIRTFWDDQQPQKIFQSLTQYSLQQLQDNIGPIRYITRITPEKEMNDYLQATKNIKRKPIMETSFFQKIFFPQADQSFITNNLQLPQTYTSSPKWNSLPKTIWVFWDTGLSTSRISNQLCVQNLRRMAAISGFKVVEVNLSNVNQYLDKEMLDQVQNSLSHAKLKTYPQSQGDLYRLALLAKHGGIYMDASYIALQTFDWIIDIGNYPSQYIFNRFGQLPKVLMLWHPHFGSPFQWRINQKYNTKQQWHLSYENNFIAAEKGSQLIQDWLQLLLSLYLKPYKQVELLFKQCQINDDKWITGNWHYLLAMDSIKCVLGQREKQIQGDKRWQGSADYYKLWSMSGYLGQQKLRINTNFENINSNDLLFVYRYSQQYVQGLLGKIRHLVKFYSLHNQQLSKLIESHKDGNFSSVAHRQSVFMKYIWSPQYKIEVVNQDWKLKVIN